MWDLLVQGLNDPNTWNRYTFLWLKKIHKFVFGTLHINLSKKNGYGSDADETLAKTQLLRIWAKFYNQRCSKGSDLYCFPTYQEVSDMFKENPEGF